MNNQKFIDPAKVQEIADLLGLVLDASDGAIYINHPTEVWRMLSQAETTPGTYTPKKPWHWPEADKDTPVDTRVFVRDAIYEKWHQRYLAGAFGKYAFAWPEEGHTSKNNGEPRFWDQVVLADPADPDQRPPADWVPGV